VNGDSEERKLARNYCWRYSLGIRKLAGAITCILRHPHISVDTGERNHASPDLKWASVEISFSGLAEVPPCIFLCRRIGVEKEKLHDKRLRERRSVSGVLSFTLSTVE
jgi:hypothetical protein